MIDGDWNTHYGSAMRASRLATWAPKAADKIVQIQEALAEEKGWKKKRHNPVLVYRGMSGVSYGVALALEMTRRNLYIGQVYVRKNFETENSHGSGVEYRFIRDHPCFFIFVDDFICSGNTTKACAEMLVGRGWLKPTERLFVLVDSEWMVLGVDPKLWENQKRNRFSDRFAWINRECLTSDPIPSSFLKEMET
jgi:hypothetical protein